MSENRDDLEKIIFFKNEFKNFILGCYDDMGKKKYICRIEKLNRKNNCLEISITDIQTCNNELYLFICEQFSVAYENLSNTLEELIEENIDINIDIDTIYLHFVDVTNCVSFKDLNVNILGQLISISGQVTQIQQLYPQLIYGTFMCLVCENVIENIKQNFEFNYPTICSNPICSNITQFILDVNSSKFENRQKVVIQESHTETSAGLTPQKIELILRGCTVNNIKPGDQCHFTGTLVIEPDTTALTGIENNDIRSENKISVQRSKKKNVNKMYSNFKFIFYCYGYKMITLKKDKADLTPEFIKNKMSKKEWQRVNEMSSDVNLCENIMFTLFPSIDGMQFIKKVLLLMLFEGVEKKNEEGMIIRGNINICILGDPSTGKSHLLKIISELFPNNVFVSGKATTAAGLTVAVVREEESDDFSVEAGAVLLANGGICCIDEFDKMSLPDQASINECMQHQTVSLAKAGVIDKYITHTGILVACNPKGGRYDRAKSFNENVDIKKSILAKFDLLILLLDDCSEDVDRNIAKAIINNHKKCHTPNTFLYTIKEVKNYISYAKSLRPTFDDEASNLLSNKYIELRNHKEADTIFKITAKHFQTMIRLSEAYAKMECSLIVKNEHVLKAFSIVEKCSSAIL